jgi:parvulin-like peptidyl-prolyl isomerase
MRKMIDTSQAALVFGLLFLPGVVFASQDPLDVPSRVIPVEGYAAVVNDRVILVSDVLIALAPIEAELRKTYRGQELMEKISIAYESALTNLVDRALILEEFSEKDAALPERVVEDQMDEMIRSRFQSRTQLLNTLTEERTTLDEWKEQVREQLIIQLMRRDNILNNVALSPGGARSLYEDHRDRYFTPSKVKLWMITIARGTTGEESVEKVEKIRMAQTRLENGEEFSVVARDLSEGSKARRGGEWGWRNPDELRPEIAEAINNTPTGEMSDVVVAGSKFYLFLIEKRKNESTVPFAEARQELERELRNQELERLSEEWLSRLRKKHFIKVFVDQQFN